MTCLSGQAIFAPFFDQIYAYAWFVGVAIAIVVYFALMRGRAVPAEEIR